MLKEITIILYLVIPHPSLSTGANIELVPNQMQFTHMDGLEVSYPYRVNDCRTVTPLAHEFVVEIADGVVCYIIDTNHPSLFRSNRWMGIHGKTYKLGE